MLKPPLTAAILCLLLLTSDTPAAGMNTMRVHFIDVGQGAATLIQFPCGSVLVDTGGERYPPEEWKSATYDSTAELIDYLDGVLGEDERLKLLLLTHPHKDHTRGVQAVIDRYLPEFVVHNGQPHGSGALDQADAFAMRRNSRKSIAGTSSSTRSASMASRTGSSTRWTAAPWIR